MKKCLLSTFTILLLLVGFFSISEATLITIGTAGYDSNGDGVEEYYNLIWDNDNNGKSLVWLDYNRHGDPWSEQMSWAVGLSLTPNLYDGYSVVWTDTTWRLPDAHNWDGSGPDQLYNVTDSEMGHLFLVELGIKTYPDRYYDVTDVILNSLEFDNLSASRYWLGTEYADLGHPGCAWYFDMFVGSQGVTLYVDNTPSKGMAVRSGQITYTAPIPEPSTIILFGLGIIGLAGLSRKKIYTSGNGKL